MKSPNHTLTILQFLLSLLAAFMFFTLSAGLLLLGTTGMISDLTGGSITNEPDIFLWVTGFSVFGLLVLPSALFALLKWTGCPYQGLKPNQRLSLSRITFLLLVIGFPTALALGWASSQHPWTSISVLPIVHVLAVGIPILWLGLIGLRGLPVGSPQRASGVFAAGLALSPFFAITLEIIAALFIFIAGIFVLSMSPEMVVYLENIANTIQQTSDPEQMLELLQPLLTNPWVITGIVLLMAVLTPLIEETIKPMGVYLLLHRRISPAEGFAAGLLNGLGFALFESLLVSSGVQEWLSTVLLRAPTAVLHGFTTALVGYGLASAASQRRYLRLAGCFLTAVTLHAIWNGLTLISAGYSIQSMLLSARIGIPDFVQIIPLILVFLSGISFLGILLLNRRLNQPVVNPDFEVN